MGEFPCSRPWHPTGDRTGRVQAAVAIANGDNRAGFGFLIRRARFLVNIGGVFFLGRQV
jgi:hypothetical protein